MEPLRVAVCEDQTAERELLEDMLDRCAVGTAVTPFPSGEALLAAFARCREELPIGFAAFHLPWVLEWLTANRQYRAAFELERDFPLRLPPRPAAAVEYDGAKGVQ